MKKNVLFILLLLSLFSCSLLNIEESREIYLNLQLESRNFTLNDISLFTLKVTGSDMSTIEAETTTDVISVEVPVGSKRTFDVHVDLINGDVWSGSTTVDVDENTDSVDIILTLLSGYNEIISLEIDGHSATIDGTEVTLELPVGSSLTALVPTIEYSAGATISYDEVDSIDFTNPVDITVTAENGKIEIYRVSITVAEAPVLSSESSITSFVLEGVEATIDGLNITVELANGTGLTSLVPTIVISDNATIDYTTDSAVDFTDGATFVVTAEDGITTSPYTVTVTLADPIYSTESSITSFILEGVEGTIEDLNISIELPYGTELSSLVPTIVISDNATIDYTTDSTVNFTSGATFVVTAEDGTTQSTYTVTVATLGGSALELEGIVGDDYTTIDITASNSTFSVGETETFTIADPGVSVKWYYNNVLLTETSNILSTDYSTMSAGVHKITAIYNDAGIYYVGEVVITISGDVVYVPTTGTTTVTYDETAATLTVEWTEASDMQTDSSLLDYILVVSDSYSQITDPEQINAVVDESYSDQFPFSDGGWKTSILSSSPQFMGYSEVYYFTVAVRDEHGNISLYPVVEETISVGVNGYVSK